MRILIVNDDGYYAPGFDILRAIAAELSDDVWAVAPETDQSGLAHSLTLGHPLRVREVDESNFILRGTPTDCVIMGVRELMPAPPDLILSGVNQGHNIADDITYSGTVAGALEGALLGIRSIALSQSYAWGSTHDIRWQTARYYGPELIQKLMKVRFDPQMFININFPDCEPMEVEGTDIAEQGALEHGIYAERRHDGRNNPYYWLRFEGRASQVEENTDIAALKNNHIAVSALRPNMTYDAGMENLREVFS